MRVTLAYDIEGLAKAGVLMRREARWGAWALLCVSFGDGLSTVGQIL